LVVVFMVWVPSEEIRRPGRAAGDDGVVGGRSPGNAEPNTFSGSTSTGLDQRSY